MKIQLVQMTDKKFFTSIVYEKESSEEKEEKQEATFIHTGRSGDMISTIINKTDAIISNTNQTINQEYVFRPGWKYIKAKEEIENGFNNTTKETKESLIEKLDTQYITMQKELLSTLDIKKYAALVDFVFVKKDDDSGKKGGEELTLLQRYIAYLVSHKLSGELNFSYRSYTESHIDDLIKDYEYLVIQKLGYDASWEDDFEIAKSVALESGKKQPFEVYHEFDSLESYLKYSLYSMATNGEQIKICKNCGQLFYPEQRSDTLYCSNISPQDATKTCKEFGAAKAYQDNLKNKEQMGLYRKIYIQKQMMVRRNPDIVSYQKDFENYKTESKRWKADVKAGTKTVADYVAWLKKIRQKEE